MFMCMSANELGVDPPINNLTYTMYRNNDGKPKAKLKAAEARSMLPVLVHMMTVFFPPRSDHDHLRLQCLVSIDNFYKELVQWRNTGVNAASEAMRFGKQFLLLYSELAVEELNGDRAKKHVWQRWRIYPKHHLFMHVLEEDLPRIGNPMECWTYGDEDFIGASVKVAQRCHTAHVPRSVVQRYRL